MRKSTVAFVAAVFAICWILILAYQIGSVSSRVRVLEQRPCICAEVENDT
jgi:hypothetical protein